MEKAFAKRQQDVAVVSTDLKKALKPILQQSEYKICSSFLNNIFQSLDSLCKTDSIDVFTRYVSSMQSSMDKLDNLLQTKRTLLPVVVFEKMEGLRVFVKFFQRRKDSEKNKLYRENVELMASAHIPYGECFADSDFCDFN